MLAALTILLAWGGYGIMSYLLLHVISCGMENKKLDSLYIIRLVAVSVILMVIMSACVASTGRVKYVSIGDSSRYSGSLSETPGTDSVPFGSGGIFRDSERFAGISGKT